MFCHIPILQKVVWQSYSSYSSYMTNMTVDMMANMTAILLSKVVLTFSNTSDSSMAVIFTIFVVYDEHDGGCDGEYDGHTTV